MKRYFPFALIAGILILTFVRVSLMKMSPFAAIVVRELPVTVLLLVPLFLAERFKLEDIDYRSGGPARYVKVAETGGRLGLITPLTHNFCESCNRVRVTCTGTLYMCLGQEDAADLRKPLRASEANDLLYAAIDEAIGRKPKGHDFIIDRRHRRPAIARHMSVTGG